MGGIGLSDFMRGLTGGAAQGQQAMSGSIGHLMQMVQQKRAQQASDAQQLAMQKSSQDFQAQQAAQAQAQAQAHFDASQQLEGAVHGLRSQPVYQRDEGAQRIVEAPQRARDFNTAHPNTNIPVPGMGGLSIPADAQVGNHPLLESMETRAAMSDPANVGALRGPEGETQAAQWERMRQQAWGKEVGKDWVRDPSLAPPPKKAPLTGAPSSLIKEYHSMASEDTPKPPRIAGQLLLLEAATRDGDAELAAKIEDTLSQNYGGDLASYRGAVEERSRKLMQDAIKGGVDEAPLLAKYLSGTGGGEAPGGQQPGPWAAPAKAPADRQQWHSMVDNVVDHKPDEEKNDAELAAAEEALGAPVPGGHPFQPRGREPVDASPQYPTAQLSQLYPHRTQMPDLSALQTAARAAPDTGQSMEPTAPEPPPPPPGPASGLTGMVNRAWTSAANSDLANTVFGIPELVTQPPDSPVPPQAQGPGGLPPMAPPGVSMRGGRVEKPSSVMPPPRLRHMPPDEAAVAMASPTAQNIRVDEDGTKLLLSGPGEPPPGVIDVRQRDGKHGVIDARHHVPGLLDKAGQMVHDGGGALANLLGLGSSSAAAAQGAPAQAQGGDVMPDAKGFPLPEELVQVGEAKLVAPAAEAYGRALNDPSLTAVDRAGLAKVFSSTRTPAQQNRLHSQWLGQGSKPGAGIAFYPPPAPEHAPKHGHLAGSGLDLHHDLTPAARQSLNRNGWHRTVKGDLGHWEFTGSTDIDEG